MREMAAIVGITAYHQCRHNILFLTNNLGVFNPPPLLLKSTELHIFTDASGKGSTGYTKLSLYYEQKLATVGK